MKIILITAFFLFIAHPVCADMVRAVDNNDKGVVILISKDLENAYKKSPYYGNKFLDIDSVKLPDRSTRNFWMMGDKQIITNQVKYDEWKAKQDKLIADKNNIKTKLNLTDDEMNVFKTVDKVPVTSSVQ